MSSIYLLNLSLGKYILMFIYSVMIFDLEVLKIMNNIMFLLLHNTFNINDYSSCIHSKLF